MTDNGYKEILLDPRRLCNFDESYFSFFVMANKSYGVHDQAHYIQPGPGGKTKETMSVGFTIFACGHWVKPFVMPSGIRDTWKQVPENLIYKFTPSGYMNHEAFLYYLEYVLYPGMSSDFKNFTFS